jgi:PAS domain S-box-containing protein
LHRCGEAPSGAGGCAADALKSRIGRSSARRRSTPPIATASVPTLQPVSPAIFPCAEAIPCMARAARAFPNVEANRPSRRDATVVGANHSPAGKSGNPARANWREMSVKRKLAAVLALTIVGLFLQILFWPFLHPRYWTFPSIVLFLCALIGGARGGALSAALSVVCIWTALVPPQWTVWKHNADFIYHLFLFLAFSALVSLVVERLVHGRQKALNRFEAMFQEAAIGIVLLSLDGKILAMNRRNTQIIGYRANELIGANWDEITFPEDREADREWLRRVASGETTTMTGDKRIVRRDGSIAWVSLTLAIKPAFEEEEACIIASVQDITQRKTAEASLSERTAASEALAERLGAERLSAIGGIAIALSHEINQPFLAASAYLDSARHLVEQSADPKLLSAVESMRLASSQLMRAGEIIRHLREFARSEEPNKTFQNLHQLIVRAVEIDAESQRSAHVVTTLRLVAARDRVLVDKVQLGQVLANLIRNAGEAMSGGETRELQIETKLQDDDHIRVDVTDTGCGIPNEIRPLAFEPFATTKPSGIGVGLAIAASIISAHYGEIWIDATSDAGTRVSFTLPLEA